MRLPLSLKALALVTDKDSRYALNMIHVTRNAGAMPVAVATDGRSLMAVQWEDAPGGRSFAGYIPIGALKAAAKNCTEKTGIPVDTDTGVIGFPPNQPALAPSDTRYPPWRTALMDTHPRPTRQVFKIKTLAATLAALEKIVGPDGAVQFSTGPESLAVGFSACCGPRDNRHVKVVGMIMSLPPDVEGYDFLTAESVAVASDTPAEKAAV